MERTETIVNVYAGVPFNTKYQNVLFVDKQTRDLFLQQYEVGQEIKVGRFEIINDTQAIIDISNDYGTMSVNYLKVHRKLIPETSNETFEYDQFYFVDHTLQIATNAVRLFLDLDIFQTYFVKYNYQTQAYEIPQIKNSRCEISTDFTPSEKMSIMEMTHFNYFPNFSALWTQTNEVYVVFTYTINNGYSMQTGFVSLPTEIFKTESAPTPTLYRFRNIIRGLQNGKIFYDISGTEHFDEMTVSHIYIVPSNMINTSQFANLRNAYLKDNTDANFQVNCYLCEITNNHFYSDTQIKHVFAEIGIQTSVGNFEKQIELPFINKTYDVELTITAGESFQVILFANNQSIDFTYSFELSLLQNAYNEFMNSHENSIAVKSVSHAINLLSGIGSLASGNPAGIISTTNTVKNIADDLATFADLKKEPAKIVAEKSITSSFLQFNMIGVFLTECSNFAEIEKTEKYYGYKMNYLTSKSFSFMPVESNKNFDYYKFSNVEIIGRLPESFKSRFEEMFLNGVRIWYSTTNFLNTIENTETQNQ